MPNGRQRGTGPRRQELTAPYNFVPLDGTVVTPDWARRVSQDVPFSDGCSGHLVIELRALTPLFVGAGKARKGSKQAGQTNKKTPFTVDGTPAVPGTSLKGAVRNVLEIASFGRIRDRMDEHRLSFRDLQNARDYTKWMTTEREGGYAPTACAGWLSLDREGGAWWLTPCDYAVVQQTDLEELHKKIVKKSVRLGKRQSAREKYKSWKAAKVIPFTPGRWCKDDTGWAKGRFLSRAENVGEGHTDGHLVMTGQPQDREDQNGERKKGTKGVEFLFHVERPDDAFEVPELVRDAFEATHRNPNDFQPNEEWRFWRTKLLKGERVPVFWLPPGEDDDAAEPVHAIGLAMMFRLPYKQTARQSAKRHQDGESQDSDFAETVFGFVNGDTALKGRVRFTDAPRVEAGEVTDERPVTAALLAPKPGFYPAYVRQNRHDRNDPSRVPLADGRDFGMKKGYADYTNLMHDDAVIRGWKRYPVACTHRPPETPPRGSNEYNPEVLTEFAPLGRGTVLRGRVDVHNLRPAELGALVWALTFGARKGGHCHALGAGRPFGYGATEIRIVDASLVPNDPEQSELDGEDAVARLWQDAVPAFEAFMDSRVSGWRSSPQIRELLAMATPVAESEAARLKQLPDAKAFQKIKGRDVRALLPLHGKPPDPGSQPTTSFDPHGGPGGDHRRKPRSDNGEPEPASAEPAETQSTVDGAPVTVMERFDNQARVQFLDSGDIDIVNLDELGT